MARSRRVCNSGCGAFSPARRSCSGPRLNRLPLAAGAAYRVTDIELASRLSFFLWSSIPDEELMRVAGEGRLSEPTVLREQMTSHARGLALDRVRQ